MDIEKIEKLREEIERLEAEYERAGFGKMLDRTKQEHLYQKLKKKRKELKELQKSAK
jgi:hypothetical protein